MQRPAFGEPAPLFVAPTSSRPDYSFGTVAGRFIVLAFVPSSRSGAGQALLSAIAAHRALFSDEHCAFFGVTADPKDQSKARVTDDPPGVRWFYDTDRAIHRAYGLEDADGSPLAAWLVLDPMLRIMLCGDAGGPVRMMETVRRLPPVDTHAGCEAAAPVLIVPRVFETGLCSALIDYYRRQGGQPSGFMVEQEGRTTLAFDPNRKRRADCVLDDERLRVDCRARILRRLAPEIAKAFQFRVTRMERDIVACYTAEEAGWFGAHRDNTTAGTAHRRFAVTLNLNAEDYEGGDLRFPEFGARSYRAPTGGAAVFSCSLLHEALPVTRGERFAFLPFLYDEAAAELRERNNRHLGADVEAYRR